MSSQRLGFTLVVIAAMALGACVQDPVRTSASFATSEECALPAGQTRLASNGTTVCAAHASTIRISSDCCDWFAGVCYPPSPLDLECGGLATNDASVGVDAALDATVDASTDCALPSGQTRLAGNGTTVCAVHANATRLSADCCDWFLGVCYPPTPHDLACGASGGTLDAGTSDAGTSDAGATDAALDGVSGADCALPSGQTRLAGNGTTVCAVHASATRLSADCCDWFFGVCYPPTTHDLACGASGGTLDAGTSDAGGTDSATPDAGSAASVGQWSPVIAWPIPAVHAAVLPNGRLMTWADRDFGPPAIWDPATATSTRLVFDRTDLHCTGESLLLDGRLLLTGGEAPNTSDVGVRDINLYDYRTNTWTVGPDMVNARWYPTQTMLPNGDTLITAGNIAGSLQNTVPEVWTAAGTLRELPGAAFGLDTYPYMYVAPNGRVFQAGPEPLTRYLDPSGIGSWSTVARSNFGQRDHGSSVMYDDGKVMIDGGSDPPTSSAEVIDLNAATPTWRATASMRHPRLFHNTTLLPDGTVFVSGGSSGASGNVASSVFNPEIWDPATERWSEMAASTIPRLYHSTALLLPDGRVFSGGGTSDANHREAEIFSPPYLFRGPRPALTSAPSTVAYGAPFFVASPDAANVARVTWVRLSAVTHGYNQGQRMNRLAFAAAPGGITVTAPSSRTLCPPGHYILFLLNNAGVPSLGSIVLIE